MTVAPYEPRINRLIEWANEADAAYALAQKLTDTAFCPPQFRRRPEDAAAAMLAGMEVGLTPLASLRAFDVIEGQAAPRAITLRALVQSRGHDIVLEESTETRCRMRGRRANSGDWQTVTWTLARAEGLKLTGKDNWRKQPGAMLLARATSEICRIVAADAILGLGGGYSAEEYGDSGGERPNPSPVSAPSQAPPGMRRMGRTPAAVEDATPEPDTPTETPREPEPPQGRPLTAIERALRHVERDPVDEDRPPPPDAPSVESVAHIVGGEVVDDTDDPTPEMRRRMFAGFGDAGWDMSDRTEPARALRLEYVSGIIRRQIKSSNELTRAEMSMVIDALDADAQAITWKE